jgi:hypothetical protein
MSWPSCPAILHSPEQERLMSFREKTEGVSKSVIEGIKPTLSVGISLDTL